MHRHEVVGAGPALAIEITWDDDQWLAVEATTAAFGEGDTPAEAQEDLLKSLREYRRALEAEPGLLADRLTEHLRLLNTALGE
ncbi:MAG TPA: hypothetical protein VMU90_13305 [Solirubrobacteraceae bacterium]|nr:hypothetical protein [Solirubrobacteraceae bacterium]